MENVPLSPSLSHNFSTLLCCPLTFLGTIHPVSQIQQGGVFQQSSNKLKKENYVFLVVIGPSLNIIIEVLMYNLVDWLKVFLWPQLEFRRYLILDVSFGMI